MVWLLSWKRIKIRKSCNTIVNMVCPLTPWKHILLNIKTKSLTVVWLVLFSCWFHFCLNAYFEHAPIFVMYYPLLEVLDLFLVSVIDKLNHNYVMTWMTRREMSMLTSMMLMILVFLINSPLNSATSLML